MRVPDGWDEDDPVLRARLVCGLRAQGHLPTIERMLGDGASWPEIGRAIGWDAETARIHYGWACEERAAASTPMGGDDA